MTRIFVVLCALNIQARYKDRVFPWHFLVAIRRLHTQTAETC
jgi:hypothetical protein